MAWIMLYDGEKFKSEHNPIRSSFMLVCKTSGRYVYVTGEAGHKFQNDLMTAWNKTGINASDDEAYEWLWLNGGYYRLAK